MSTVIDGTSGVTSNSVALSSSTGIGYTTGSGGAVTQATNKSTAVTLNALSGKITMNNASLAASTTVAFNLNNSFISAADIVVGSVFQDGITNPINYNIWSASSASGLATIYVRNISGGALTDAVPISFAIIKGATS